VSSYDRKHSISTSKPTATDLTRIVLSPDASPSLTKSQSAKGNDFNQPLSNSTRLQSLNLINEAFRCFSAIESTLSNQRRQSQVTSLINPNRSRFNSTASSSYSKNNESNFTQAQS
jgi:hypothetical protein